jgi:Ca2+-binding RTX toxin-like protein
VRFEQRVLRLIAGSLGSLTLGATTLAMGSAHASSTCVYDPVNRTAMVVLDSGATSSLVVGSDQAIQVDGQPCSEATTTNTDSLRVTSAPAQTPETLVIDLQGGAFAPGATIPDDSGDPEIELDVDLGEGADAVIVQGGPGPDVLAVTGSGAMLNSDDDVDVGASNVERIDLYGKQGDDELSGGPGDDTMGGGGDRDTITYGDSGNGVTMDLGARTAQGEGSDIFADRFEVAVGSPRDDRLTGSKAADELLGLDGNDVLNGLAGSDVLRGGSGADAVSYASSGGGVTLSLVTGKAAGEGLDHVTGVEDVTGSAFRDDIAGSSRPNRLLGGGGNDRIAGHEGSDYLGGGAGEDDLSPGAGVDTVDGGTGGDTIAYSAATGRVRVDLAAGAASGQGKDTLRRIQDVQGSPFGDDLLGSRAKNDLGGRGGDDHIGGRGGPDFLIGSKGRDSLFGHEGRDRLQGSGGDDSLSGGPGNDYLSGDTGGDLLRGGADFDTCLQDGGRGKRRGCELPSGHALMRPSPPGKIVVVNANLHEAHIRAYDSVEGYPLHDLNGYADLRNFAKRVKNKLSYAPDVLLHQEVLGRSARKTADLLSALTGYHYRAVIRPGRKLYPYGVDRDPYYKKNTAVIINTTTMSFQRGGFFTIVQAAGDTPAGKNREGQFEAHALVREKQTGERVAVIAVHFRANKGIFVSNRKGNRRRAAWATEVSRFMKNKYPHAKLHVVGGEFGQARCTPERLRCKRTRYYKVFTDQFGYKDAIYKANSTSLEDLRQQATSRRGKVRRIDYTFVRGTVFNASRDFTYDAAEFTSHFYSDHRFEWSVVGPRG